MNLEQKGYGRTHDEGIPSKPAAGGQDLRDIFAGLAMQAMVTQQWSIDAPENLVKQAYQFADLMLIERKNAGHKPNKQIMHDNE